MRGGQSSATEQVSNIGEPLGDSVDRVAEPEERPRRSWRSGMDLAHHSERLAVERVRRRWGLLVKLACNSHGITAKLVPEERSRRTRSLVVELARRRRKLVAKPTRRMRRPVV